MMSHVDHAPLNSLPTADGALAYRDHGEGPLLVLLHSGFADHRVWEAQMTSLSKHHRVVAPDARGHGSSANASRPFRAADDVAELITALDAGPAVLVGLSMGGATAVDTALEHPELVRALVVAGAGTSQPAYRDPWLLQILEDQQRALAAGDIEAWSATWLRCAAGPHRTLDDIDGQLLARLREMALNTISKHTPDEPDHSVPVEQTWERLGGIRVPVLAVTGELDSSDHLDEAEKLVARVADGRLATVAGAAHYPNMEAPARFDALVTEFLRGLRA